MALNRHPALRPLLLRLAHGWTLFGESNVSGTLVREFARPAVRAVPSSMAHRLRACRISLAAQAPGAASRWTTADDGLEIAVATANVEKHDVAMEILLCLGQALWERLSDAELRSYCAILSDEINQGVDGEIDEQALEEKRRLFQSRSAASSAELLAGSCRASFAGTLAEYVHSLWHDVSVRTGPEHLPAAQLRRRLELLASWFPPNRGYQLFPAPRRRRPSPATR